MGLVSIPGRSEGILIDSVRSCAGNIRLGSSAAQRLAVRLEGLGMAETDRVDGDQRCCGAPHSSDKQRTKAGFAQDCIKRNIQVTDYKLVMCSLEGCDSTTELLPLALVFNVLRCVLLY